MISKIKINKNLILGTTDKQHPRTLYLEGLYYVIPEEDFSRKDLYSRLRKYVGHLLPNFIADFDIPDNAEVGKICKFSFQINFLTSAKNFNSYAKRLIPLICDRMPQFLSVLPSCGFRYQSQKKSLK